RSRPVEIRAPIETPDGSPPGKDIGTVVESRSLSLGYRAAVTHHSPGLNGCYPGRIVCRPTDPEVRERPRALLDTLRATRLPRTNGSERGTLSPCRSGTSQTGAA